MSLLELTAATTMMAMLMASTVVLVRSSYAVWQATEGDLERAESGNAVLRHIVRSARQATAVVDFSSNNLSLRMDSGEVRQWLFDGGSEQMLYGMAPGAADQIVADNLLDFTFVGYEADGVTTTTNLDDIHAIHCAAVIVMPAGGGQNRTVSCWTWIRSW